MSAKTKQRATMTIATFCVVAATVTNIFLTEPVFAAGGPPTPPTGTHQLLLCRMSV